MAKPTHIARYYADDKDVFDLLSLGNVNMTKLHSFLRQRGIVVSPTLDKEEIARYFQRSPLSWPQLESLLSLIDRAEREDKFTTCKIDATDTSVDSVISAVAAIQNDRGERCGEVFKTEKIGDGGVEITVSYAEPDLSKTRCLQKDDKTLVIRLVKENGGFKVRRHDNERSAAILDQVEKLLSPSDTTHHRKRRARSGQNFLSNSPVEFRVTN
jgi:hypothetical protein